MELCKLVSNIKCDSDRFKITKNNSDKNVIVEYVHTPNDLEKLLMRAREITDGKIITVFGCIGDSEKIKRKIMGMAAGILSDYCIITSDKPKTEDPIKIIEDIEDGMIGIDSKYEKIVDRKKAIEKALNIIEEDDLLIIVGTYLKDYKLILDIKANFRLKKLCDK